MNALSASGLGKAYRGFKSPWQRMGFWFDLARPDTESWVLSGVDFTAAPGETIGILGHNGAGKSTLLKIIAGTLQPSTGAVAVRGRVAAILELGIGFDPELTGKENARHGLNLLGLSIQEVDELLPAIESFAEIGTFFDKPLRTYSSGMQVRVAFAVATAVRPDLLIVDEALSVGDAYFQHKSFRRIREFQQQGTTLLFVSHDTNSIQAICDRAILLDRGRLVKDGPPEAVIDYYNALVAKREGEDIQELEVDGGKVQTISGSKLAEIKSVRLLDAEGQVVENVMSGRPMVIEVAARINAPLESLVFGFSIRDRLGQTIFGTNTWYTDQTLTNVSENQDITFRTGLKCDLGPGTYSVTVALTGGETHLTENFEWRNLAVVFDVVNLDHPTFIGCARLEPTIQVKQHNERHERGNGDAC